jgi:hypothetical protein
MTRIDVFYDGGAFTVANHDLDELEAEISDLVSAGVPGWLTVNMGEGKVKSARLLITASTSIALVAVPEPSEL